MPGGFALGFAGLGSGKKRKRPRRGIGETADQLQKCRRRGEAAGRAYFKKHGGTVSFFARRFTADRIRKMDTAVPRTGARAVSKECRMEYQRGYSISYQRAIFGKRGALGAVPIERRCSRMATNDAKKEGPSYLPTFELEWNARERIKSEKRLAPCKASRAGTEAYVIQYRAVRGGREVRN